ncbi:MAG: alkaline phosphatase D family protein [Halieaceae bacterium]|nr:alkaline phosphatase D family protein [Halieaceae bacterium]
MRVNKFTVGPIVGATDTKSTRIFGRGEYVVDGGQLRRGHAIIRWRKAGGNFGKPKYFKLNPNFDMSAVCVVEGLSANSSYEYQAGYVYSDVDSADIDVSAVLDWSSIPVNRVTTGASGSASRTLVVGSCRYLLRFLGGTFFDDRGDKTFRSIKKLKESAPVHALVMTGDQIYADDLNILNPDQSVDEYLKRYRQVFSQKHIAGLMAEVPTYMTLDDHEIEDNWPTHSSQRDYVTKFPAAMHAYQTYQTSHSPLHPVVNGRVDSPPDYLWYTHSDGCCNFFVMDTRTERRVLEGDPAIISDEQMEALLEWLSSDPSKVKVVVTAVPFWESDSEDKWEGFLAQRDQILEHIDTLGIRRVLFLSGDVHASMSSELELPNSKIVSVVSSAFYWPYPHPGKKSFVLSGNIKTGLGKTFRVKNASKVHATDNFARLQVDTNQVKVEVYSRKGKRQGTKTHQF